MFWYFSCLDFVCVVTERPDRDHEEYERENTKYTKRDLGYRSKLSLNKPGGCA